MGRRTGRIPPSRGFSMLEVLVAAIVLGVAMLALMRMQVVAMQGNEGADRMTSAMYLAQGKLAELSSLDYFLLAYQISTAPFPVDTPALRAGSYNETRTATGVAGEGTTYTIRWSIRDLAPPNPFEKPVWAKEFEVWVSYRDPLFAADQGGLRDKTIHLGPIMRVAEYR